MLHGHNASSHEGATVSDRSTINSGLPHHYRHENLINLFSGEQLLAVFIACGCISAFHTHITPGSSLGKMHSRSDFFRDKSQV